MGRSTEPPAPIRAAAMRLSRRKARPPGEIATSAGRPPGGAGWSVGRRRIGPDRAGCRASGSRRGLRRPRPAPAIPVVARCDRCRVFGLADAAARLAAVRRAYLLKLVHQVHQVPCAERGAGAVTGDEAGRDDRPPAARGLRPAACGRIVTSGCAASNCRRRITGSSAPPPTARRAGRSVPVTACPRAPSRPGS